MPWFRRPSRHSFAGPARRANQDLVRRVIPTLAALLLAGAATIACLAPTPPSLAGPTSRPQAAGPARNSGSEAASAAPTQGPVNTRSEVIVDGVLLPAALTFAPDGRLFFVEVNAGRIRMVKSGQLEPHPFATLPVMQAAESGLLGLTLDPDFNDNHFVYAYYSDAEPGPSGRLRNRVVRFTDRNGEGVDMAVILDDLPASQTGAVDAHQGGALTFGPDGKLYVSIGDTGNSSLAQDNASLAGKILRLNADGSVPADNPAAGSPVFASGFRNPWGMTFHPRSGQLFVTDNGNKSHDELNRVVPGGNYGWPLYEGIGRDPRFVDPVWDSGSGDNSRNGMAGVAAYDGPLFPELQDEVLFCSFKSGRIRRVALKPPAYEQQQSVRPLEGECRLGITMAPDGSIYVSTINQIVRLTR